MTSVKEQPYTIWESKSKLIIFAAKYVVENKGIFANKAQDRIKPILSFVYFLSWATLQELFLLQGTKGLCDHVFYRIFHQDMMGLLHLDYIQLRSTFPLWEGKCGSLRG